MISHEKEREATVHPAPKTASIVPLGEPSTLELLPGGGIELLQLDGNASVYEVSALGAVELRTGGCDGWSAGLRLERESIRLRLDAQDRIAIEALDDVVAINAAPATPRQLFVDRIFDGHRNGCTLAPRAPVPGAVLQLLLVTTDMLEGDALPADPPAVSFTYRGLDGPGERIDLAATFCDARLFEEAGVEPGDRRVIDVCIPEEARPGSGRLVVDWGGDLYLDGLDFEIADPTFVKVREKLARHAASEAKRVLGLEPAVIGGYAPLPVDTEVCEALTGLNIYTVPDDDTFLFYGFDPVSLFEQPRTVWMLASPGTERFETFVRPSWPEVIVLDGDGRDDGITCRGSRIGLDFGSPDNQRNQFFGGPGAVDDRPVAPPEPRAPQREPLPGLAGRPFVGGTAANCARVTKIAVLVQLDDNNARVNRRGVEIPDFDDVMRRERALVKALGFDQTHELRPDDFITDYSATGRPRFRRPTSSNARSLQPLLDRIDRIVRGIKDCCTELAIFVNAHQSREGYLRYRNKDVPRRDDPAKTVDVKESISAAYLSRLVADQIQTSTAAAGLPCQPPAELIFHSCFSGRFANGQFDKANRAGLGITASSGGGQTTKGRRNGGAATSDEYFFLDALEECARQSPDRTIADIFDCIRQRTDERSGGTQRPVRKPPRRP